MHHSPVGHLDHHILREENLLLTGGYDPVAVMLSIAMAVLASYAALGFANRMRWGDPEYRKSWLLLGSLTMGVGIWSMHLIGMLAYQIPIPVKYDLTITLFSILPSILGCGSGVSCDWTAKSHCAGPGRGLYVHGYCGRKHALYRHAVHNYAG